MARKKTPNMKNTAIAENSSIQMTTKKPKEIYKLIMQTKLCDRESRDSLYEYLKKSMKQHYHTIFGDVPDGDIDFGFAFDGTLMMGLQVPDGMDWCQYSFSVLDILVNIPLDQVDKWCLETCIAELSQM